MASIISLVMASRARGNSAATRRNTRPKATTAGPESQTIFNTGGTLRRALKRSSHPLQKLSCCFIGFPARDLRVFLYLQTKGKVVDYPGWFKVSPLRSEDNRSVLGV